MRAWLGFFVGAVTGCQALLALDATGGGDASVSVDGSAVTDAASDTDDVRNDSALDAGMASDSDPCPPYGSGVCRDDGGFVWRGRCYFLIDPAEQIFDNQASAAGQCSAQDASLVTITCEEELKFLLTKIHNNAWTGAKLVGSSFAWSTQEPWSLGPLSGDAADEGCVWLDTNRLRLWVVDCTARAATTLCEQGPLAR